MSIALPVHAVLLAAGSSTRFGSENKLLSDVDGEPLVARVATRLARSGVGAIIAVVAAGADGSAVAQALQHHRVRIVLNPHAERGMGTSIACGVAAVQHPHAGIMVLPGDMPMVDATLLNHLIAAYREANGEMIVHPLAADGTQRNPVIWPPWARLELSRLSEGNGGKKLLAHHVARTRTLPSHDDDVFEDIDTKQDLARFRALADND